MNVLIGRYVKILNRVMPLRKPLVLACDVLAVLILAWVGGSLGSELFPKVEGHEMRLCLRAQVRTRIEETERLTLKVLDTVKSLAGRENVDIFFVLLSGISLRATESVPFISGPAVRMRR